MAARNLIASSKVRHSILVVGNPDSMSQIVISRLKAGLIYAQATKMITIAQGHVTTASPKGIDASLWAAASADPVSMANMWKTGELAVTNGGTAYQMIGIHFDGDQIDEVIEAWATPPDEWIQLKGGKPTAKWWSLFAVELARHAFKEGIPVDETDRSISGLVTLMQDRLAEAGVEKGPDATSIRPTIELLVQRHKANA